VTLTPGTTSTGVPGADSFTAFSPSVEAIDQPEMDDEELTRLERVIERGHQTFIEVGEALLSIRERKGYRRVGFPTFEAYLKERWGWSRQRGYQLIRAAGVLSDLRSDGLSTSVVIPSEHHARVIASLAPAERRTLVNQLGDLGQYSTRELHHAARVLKKTIQERPTQPRAVPPRPVPDVIVDPDDRIETGLAEDLRWSDGEIDIGITSPPYCLGSAIPYEDGGDYDDYDYYRDELVPLWCRELLRVSNPEGGRWCVNVPLDSRGPGRGEARQARESRPVYADWLHALTCAGFAYRTTILWRDDQAGRGTDRGTPDPSAPHVTAPVEAIIVVHRGAWKRDRPAQPEHELDHEAWLEMCGPRGLWRFRGVHDPAHPAPLPEELPRRLLALYSWHGDVVGDAFVGRGTTAAVAARLGRRVRAIDRSRTYVNLARAWVARERAAARARADRQAVFI
jgi:DNA modification methylase